MAERGRRRNRRGRPAEGAPASRPERVRREAAGKPRIRRTRSGSSPIKMANAAKVLGMSTTRRAAVVAIVVCALAFTIAVPLRTYLSQRSEVSEQDARRIELQQEVAELEGRKAQLSDPGQVEAEARRRLRFVMPGETPYIVQLPEDKPPSDHPVPGEQTTPTGPWYDRLWQSISGSQPGS